MKLLSANIKIDCHLLNINNCTSYRFLLSLGHKCDNSLPHSFVFLYYLISNEK